MAIEVWVHKTPRYFILAWVFFILVVILTVGVYVYKSTISSENDDISSEIKELQETIAKMRDDKDIQAYELYDKNSSKLDSLTYFSNIPRFYSEILKLWRKYNLDFSNFQYSNEKIKVWTSAWSDSSDEAYEKLELFINDFRKSQKTEDNDTENDFSEPIFDLEFVNSFFWSNRISAALEFTVLAPKKVEKETEKQKEQKLIEEVIKK